MSFDYFSAQLHDSEDRDKLLYYAGMLQPFQDLIGSCYAGVQPGFKDTDKSAKQYIGFVIYSDNSKMPDDGYYIDIYPDGTVLIVDRISYPSADNNAPDISAEEHFTTIKQLLNWLRSQPPKLHAYW